MDDEALERKKKHVAEEYLSSLSDLQCNSKPLINVLTMLAEENIDLAPVIVKVVEQHIIKVPTELKLPILYLIDSIVKNVKNSYVSLFGQCIVNIFCHVFEKVNEKTRERMYALRQTWNEVFPASKLYSLDTRVRQMDKGWPITAIKPQPTAIHVNPNFLKSGPSTEIGDVLKAKTRELLELRKRKLELELEATKKHLEEQGKALEAGANLSDSAALDSSLLPTTSAAQMQTMAPMDQHMPTMALNPHYVRPPMRMPMPGGGQHNVIPMGAQMHPGAMVMPSNMNKVKVHPVNPALLNSIRQRDPRLMRQQMHHQQQQQPQHLHHQQHQQQVQQQLQQHQQQQLMSNMRSTPPIDENAASQMHSRHQQQQITNETTKRDRRGDGTTTKTHKSSNRNRNAVDSTKSSTRHTSSQDRMSQRSSSGSKSSSSVRDKDRERKREGKNFSSPSSSERHHQKNRDGSSKHSKGDKSSSDVNSSPSSSRHSKSPNSSPMKPIKDSSRRGAISNKSNSNQKNKNGQIPLSNLPHENIVSSSKDIDLRSLSIAADSSNLNAEKTTTTVASSSIANTEPSKKLSATTTVTAVVSSQSAAAAATAAVKGLEQNIKRKFVEPAAVTMTADDISPTAATKANKTAQKIEDEDLRQLLPTVFMTNVAPTTTMPQQFSQVLDEYKIKPAIVVVRKSVLDKKQTTLNLDASSSSTKSLPTPPPTNQPPKVSFKIQKLFNKLAKSTENTTAATVTTTTPSIPRTPAKSSTPMETIEITAKNVFKSNFEEDDAAMDFGNEHDMDVDAKHMNEDIGIRTKGDGKKRLSESGAIDEPIAKKSKSAKMDALFGSEDVDLRTLAPPILAAPIVAANEVLVAPPPPIISSSDDDQKEERTKKREHMQASKSTLHAEETNTNVATTSSPHQKAAPSFEDVRRKFAKATKIDGLSKTERAIDKTRAKLIEISANDDENTQEANDEKVRTILSQAQELYDSNSINREQYKQLVQTVMSINENTKLKEAKRRESMQQQKQQKQQNSQNSPVKSPKKDASPEPPSSNVIEDGDAAVDNELMIARNAVLRKRIPKLSKKASAASDEHTHTKSPIAADVDDERDESVSNLNRLKPKEKRQRRAKYAEPNAGGNSGDNTQSQRSWQQTGSGVSKRNSASSRSNAAPIPPPPQPPVQPLLIVGTTPLAGNWPSGPSSRPPIGFGPNAPTTLPIVRSSIPPPPQPPLNLPAVLPTITPNNLPKPCNSIDNPQADLVRTIHIDGQSKDIRIYDDVAIVFMDRDEPREIGFQPGQRAIIIDNQEPFTLRFNDEYKPIMIDGEVHRVRFGFPSRELYIDDDWYEIYFGGPPVSIPIQNKIHVLKAEGPPPQVNIGPVRRDLVVGRITMIVEAVHIFTLFLDARLQNFEYKNEIHTVQFADNLLTVMLDGKPQQVVYGGLPKPFMLKGKRYFIRFTTLPEGVVAGKVKIKDMLYIKTEPPAKVDLPAINENIAETTKDNNSEPEPNKTEADQTTETSENSMPPALDKINIDELLQKLVSTGILNNNAGKLNTPVVVNAEKSIESANRAEPTTTIAVSKTESEPVELPEEEKLPPIIPIDLNKPNSIKTRQEAIISMLYSGMQCSSCGVRFPPEQTIKYSQHLDWHFRQNRRERDSTRKAHSRKWYYELNDWLQYEEIEDIDEREKNFFETQQCELDALDDISNQRSTNSPQPTCAAGPNDVDRTCDMCHERFEQFYNEELEEWHLRLAIRVEDKIYHPLCYDDYKASLNPPTETEAPNKSTDEDVIMNEDDNAVDAIIKIEEDENDNDDEAQKTAYTIAEDDDDDVIVLPNEEPSVTEIVDDEEEEEYVPVNVTREEMLSGQDDDQVNEESDVEIQEPHIPFHDLDTYVEKELPYDENTQSSLMNVKIKEEPKEDDEDDGFEDVGTVMYGPHDEISIQSSEETQTHTILSSVDSPATISGDPSPATNMFGSSTVEQTTAATAPTTKTTQNEANMEDNSNISMEGNFEPSEGHHNLSISGPPPAVSIGSLVNKIKINITKSSATAAQTAASAHSTETTTTTTSHLSSTNNNTNNNNNEAFNQNSSKTHVISTIPVLCGGGSMSAATAANTTASGSGSSGSQVSNITVIGSYGSRYQPQQQKQQQSVAAPTTSVGVPQPQQRQRTPTPPIEDTITFELKPALQKATLKKMKKVECGVETSGLCSIM